MKKVALFIPCFVDQLNPEVGIDMARVLRRIGYNLDFPEAQTCCGQPAFNSGYWDEARPLAERFVRIFGASRADAIVCPSGSCTTMVRNFYPDLLAGGVVRSRRLGACGSRVRILGISGEDRADHRCRRDFSASRRLSRRLPCAARIAPEAGAARTASARTRARTCGNALLRGVLRLWRHFCHEISDDFLGAWAKPKPRMRKLLAPSMSRRPTQAA